MQERIDKATRNSLCRSFLINGPGTSGYHVNATAINELIELMNMQNIPDEGFHGIHLVNFGDIGELDVGVLKRLVSESKSLTHLTVSEMESKKLSIENK